MEPKREKVLSLRERHFSVPATPIVWEAGLQDCVFCFVFFSREATDSDFRLGHLIRKY